MAPTILPGQTGVDQFLANDIPIDMGTEVFSYDPPGNPYTRILTKRLKPKNATDRTVRWREDDIIPFWVQSNETVAAGILDMDLQVGQGQYVMVGDLLKVPATGEVIRITGITGDNIQFTRSWGAPAAATITANDFLLNLRLANEEGADSPQAKATLKVEKSNFTEIVRTPVHITGTAKAVSYYHGSEEAYQLKQAGERHARTWEEISLHGVKEDAAGTTHHIRSAGGIDEHITTNVLDVSVTGVLSESVFRAWLAEVFRFRVNGGRGGSKILLASAAIKNTIDSWGLLKLQMNEKASATYGMDIMTYIGSTGRLEVIYDPLLEFGYNGFGYVIDPDGTRWRPLQSRGTRLHRNIENPGEDGAKHEFLTEATFQFALEKAFGRIEGVTYG